MDEVLKIIKMRRSVRDFRKEGIPDTVIRKLVDAILWAPSAGNLQSRKFYFVTDSKIKRNLAVAALNQSFIDEAPLVVVGCTDSRIMSRYGERGLDLYAIQDVACSVMNMMLVAFENGLGSVWVGAFRERDVSEILALPGHLRAVALVPVGYSSRTPSAPPRVSEKEAVELR
ncbi:MAG TPA: nitroreductase family protein [Thermodesulfovibrionales bacterium]|nr:nitroreductase family protein [Thermodesulfovibrionales bacterium]